MGDGGFVQVGKHTARLVFRVGSTVVLLHADGTSRGSAVRLLLTLARNIATRLLAPPQSALDRALGGSPTDTSLPRAIALRAFAAVYGLPGVTAPRGAPTPDGTEAIALLLRYASTLTPAQRAAAERAIGARLPGTSGALPQARTWRGVALPIDGPLTAVAQGYADKYNQLMGTSLSLPIHVSLVNDLPRANADAAPVDSNGIYSSTPSYCQIRGKRAVFRSRTASENEGTIAHEVFHCVEFQLNPTGWPRLSAFVMEGLAEYAAATVAPEKRRRQDFAENYFGVPEKAAQTRTYDAAYVYGRVEEYRGKPLWDEVNQLVHAYDSASIFQILQLSDSAFLDSWASSLFRVDLAGSAWTTHHPESWSNTQVPSPIDYVADTAAMSVHAFGNSMYEHLASQDLPIMMVRLDKGFARVGDDLGSVNVPMDTSGNVVWVCGGGVDCNRCPNGGRAALPSGIQFAKGLSLNVGLSGGETGGSGAIAIYSINDFCAAIKPVPNPDRGGHYWTTLMPSPVYVPAIALPETTHPRRIAAAPNMGGEIAYLHQAYDVLVGLIDAFKIAQAHIKTNPGPASVSQLDQRRENMGAVYADISSHYAVTLYLVGLRRSGYRAPTPAQMAQASRIDMSATKQVTAALSGH